MKNDESLIPPIEYIRRKVGETIHHYKMIKANDRILVGLSGGKDSWCLLHVLHYFQKVSPVTFELFPTVIDAGFPGFDIPKILSTFKIFFPSLHINIVKTSIFETIKHSNTKGKNPCAFCARLRRGALYRVAKESRYNVIALGHHADDALELLLMSLVFQGSLTSIPPVLTAENNLKVIRPLILIFEEDIISYTQKKGFPQIRCPADWTTVSEKKLKIRNIVSTLKSLSPLAPKHMLSSLKNINVSHFFDKNWL